MKKELWILCGPVDCLYERSTSITFTERHRAVEVARELAQRHPGQTFYIGKAENSFCLEKLTEESF